jgi:DNA-binding beta-propeller fold protein YncE
LGAARAAAYVSGYFESDSTVESDTPAPMTPIRLATGTPGKPLHPGNNPEAIAITPDGAIAFVVNWQSWGMVTPVNTATGRLGKPIKVGNQPIAIAITPR